MNKMEYEEYWNKCSARISELFAKYVCEHTAEFHHKMLGTIICEKQTRWHSKEDWRKERFAIIKVNVEDEKKILGRRYQILFSDLTYSEMVDMLAFGSKQASSRARQAIEKE